MLQKRMSSKQCGITTRPLMTASLVHSTHFPNAPTVILIPLPHTISVYVHASAALQPFPLVSLTQTAKFTSSHPAVTVVPVVRFSVCTSYSYFQLFSPFSV